MFVYLIVNCHLIIIKGCTHLVYNLKVAGSRSNTVSIIARALSFSLFSGYAYIAGINN